MENQIAEKPDAVASEIMKADPYLKPTFEGYLDLHGSAELVSFGFLPESESTQNITNKTTMKY